MLLNHFKQIHDNEIPPQFQQRKKFICNICSEIFLSNSNLWYHKKKHKFSKEELQKINKAALAAKSIPVDCPQCGKTLSSNKKLRMHIKNNHETRDLKCTTCQKAFGTKDGLRQHFKYCLKKDPEKKGKQ